MGRPHRSPSYPKRIPGIPILGKFRVRQSVRPYPPPLVDPTDFSSDLYGGFGATTTVDFWPGESDPIEIEFSPDNDALRAPARSRLTGRRGSTPAFEQSHALQTVSNRRRAEVAHLGGGVEPVPGPGSAAVPVSGGGGESGGTFSAFESSGPVPDDSFVPTTFRVESKRNPGTFLFSPPNPSAPTNEPVVTRREANVPAGSHIDWRGKIVPNLGQRRAAEVPVGYHLSRVTGEIVPNKGKRFGEGS